MFEISLNKKVKSMSDLLCESGKWCVTMKNLSLFKASDYIYIASE